jgi:O-antigen ligase
MLPLPGNFPLLGLALCSTLAVATNSRARAAGWSPLTLAVLAFLGATVVSTVWSVDLDRSLRLSMPFLPAGLLFMIITAPCTGPQDIRRLYLALSAVGLGLAVTVLWGAWMASHGLGLNALVPRLGIPILVVPNDVTVLAVIAPLSWVLLCREPRGLVGLVPMLSILLSAVAVCVYLSRTAVLTMLITLLCAAVLSQRFHRRTLWTVGVLAVLLLGLLTWIDIPQVPGPSLLTKFLERGLGRIPYWTTAWTMFLDAPLVGQGPHTFGLFHKTPWTHNLYLEILAEQGLLGLLALGSLLICGLVGGWRLRRAQTEDGCLLGAGAFAGLVGFCAAGVVELTLLREWVVTMLFMLLGVIGHLISRQPQRGNARKWSIALERIALLKGGLPWRTVPPR